LYFMKAVFFFRRLHMYYDFFHKTQCFPVFRTDYNSHYISYTSL